MKTVEAYEVVEAIVQALDAKYPKWDLYRSNSHAWIFAAGDVRLSSGDIVNTLLAGRDHVALPKIPRKPRLFVEGEYVPVKRSGGWGLRNPSGGEYGVTLKTKKAAADFYQRVCRESVEEMQAWNAKYGAAVATGREGTDWEWK